VRSDCLKENRFGLLVELPVAELSTKYTAVYHKSDFGLIYSAVDYGDAVYGC